MFLELNLQAQNTDDLETVKSSSVTIGILQGSGSIFRVVFEGRVYENLALYFGEGYIGEGAVLICIFLVCYETLLFESRCGNSHVILLVDPNFGHRS